MKKSIRFSKSTKNAFLIPLLVATLLILGVVVYATLGGTEIRSKAANYAKCMLPTKSGAYGKLICKSGFSLNSSNKLCCPLVQETPCTPRPACLDANPPCRIKLAAGSAPFCPTSTPTSKPTFTPTPCTPRPACLDADSPCTIKMAPGSPPFCPRKPTIR